MTYTNIALTQSNGVAIIEFDNPPLNVITFELAGELKSACAELAADDGVRAVIIRSAHRGILSGGADISMMMRAADDPSLFDRFAEVNDVFDQVQALPMPTLCQLEGIALGGALELALACDFRIAGDDLSQVGLPEVRLGLLPGGGGTQRLPRVVGVGVATEMIMKGMRYDARTALEKGLVHEVVPAAELSEHVERRAASLAAQAPRALRHIKRLIRASCETTVDEGVALERELFQDLLRTKDVGEGISAAMENRKPTFVGA